MAESRDTVPLKRGSGRGPSRWGHVIHRAKVNVLLSGKSNTGEVGPIWLASLASLKSAGQLAITWLSPTKLSQLANGT